MTMEQESNDDKEASLRAELTKLKQQHRVFDESIVALESSVHRDQLQLSRLKRQKLLLKDRIQELEDSLLPDIIA